jgi:hypothetical protein
MKKRKYIGILAAAFALMLALAACGTDNTAASPSPSATTSAVPTVSPDSAEENSGDVTDPENSVDAGDDGDLGSMTEPEDKNSDRETGSTTEGSAADPDENGTKPNGENSARDDLGETGDDLADAARNAGRRMENGIRDMT